MDLLTLWTNIWTLSNIDIDPNDVYIECLSRVHSKDGEEHMKKIIIFMMVSLMIICCASCGTSNNTTETIENKEETIDTNKYDYSYETLNLFDFKEEINARHKEMIENPDFEDFSPYTPSDSVYRGLVSESEIRQLLQQNDKYIEKVSAEELYSDIDLMFRAIKSSYGSYYYFGVENFDKAETELKEWIKTQDSFRTTTIGKKLEDTFAFVRDGHFSVNRPARYREGFKYSTYILEDQYYSKDDKGFYKLHENSKWYFEDLDDPDTSMELFLNNEGELVYSPVRLSNTVKKTSVITLKSDEDLLRQETVTWIENIELHETSRYNPDFKYSRVGDVAYISLRLGARIKDFPEYKEFINSAKDCHNAKIIIFDIRSNEGGAAEAFTNWINTYANISNIGDYLPKNQAKRISDITLSYGNIYGQHGFYTETKNGKQLSNDATVLVLTDSACGSNGETLQKDLMNMENVIILGSNTAGAQIGGSQMSFTLPNTGIQLAFGDGLQFSYGSENIDGIGYDPDIYTNVRNGLNSTFEYLINNGYLSKEDKDTIIDSITDITVHIDGYGHEIYSGKVGDRANFGTRGNSEEFDVYTEDGIITDFEVESLNQGFIAENRQGRLYLEFDGTTQKTNYFKVMHSGKSFIFGFDHYE